MVKESGGGRYRQILNHLHATIMYTFPYLTCAHTEVYFSGGTGNAYLSTHRAEANTDSLTNRTTVARRARFLVPKAEEILPAPLTVGAISVILAVGTVATVAGGTV